MLEPQKVKEIRQLLIQGNDELEEYLRQNLEAFYKMLDDMEKTDRSQHGK